MRKVFLSILLAIGAMLGVYAQEVPQANVEQNAQAAAVGGEQGASAQLTPEQAGKIALGAVKGQIVDIDFEYHENAYEVEVLDSTGKKFEVKINATTGAVIYSKLDD